MKLLLHTCCAPCSVYCIDSLRKEEIEPTVYWFNPNIHPYMEYKSRRDCLKEYTKSIEVEAIFEENYGLQEFCKHTINDLQNRCKNYCYPVRLEQTAKYAKENGYTHFSTTLLVSPYQNHEAIIEVANKMANKYDVEFLYRDFRIGFWEGHQKAHDLADVHGAAHEKLAYAGYKPEPRPAFHRGIIEVSRDLKSVCQGLRRTIVRYYKFKKTVASAPVFVECQVEISPDGNPAVVEHSYGLCIPFRFGSERDIYVKILREGYRRFVGERCEIIVIVFCGGDIVCQRI